MALMGPVGTRLFSALSEPQFSVVHIQTRAHVTEHVRMRMRNAPITLINLVGTKTAYPYSADKLKQLCGEDTQLFQFLISRFFAATFSTASSHFDNLLLRLAAPKRSEDGLFEI
jgi:hypothetical protein